MMSLLHSSTLTVSIRFGVPLVTAVLVSGFNKVCCFADDVVILEIRMIENLIIHSMSMANHNSGMLEAHALFNRLAERLRVCLLTVNKIAVSKGSNLNDK